MKVQKDGNMDLPEMWDKEDEKMKKRLEKSSINIMKQKVAYQNKMISENE